MPDQQAITAFTTGLRTDGYSDPVEVIWEAGTDNPDHAHDFSARGLVLEGNIRMGCGGEVRDLGPGDIFDMTAGTIHSEAVDENKAVLMVGRK